MSTRDDIAVVGLWHLGPVLAACWADQGHRVTCVDPRPDVVAALGAGRLPVFEPGLEDLMKANSERVTFCTDLRRVEDASFVFLTFDTPVDARDRPDLAPLDHALEQIAPHLRSGAIVIVSSQVPVGTCVRWRNQLRTSYQHHDLDLACSPENLRLGSAIELYRWPDRIVVGADSRTTTARVSDLFGCFGAPVITMSLASAEMAKHALNAFLATSVSFANQLADLCEHAGADGLDVVRALHTDRRVGPLAFLSAGFGFAGGTLGRDVQALRGVGRASGVDTPLLDAVLEINRKRPLIVIRRLRQLYGDLRGLRVGILGLTYKAGTSTLRRSVAIEVIDSLVDAGTEVRAFDPRADLSELDGRARFKPVPDAYAVAEDAAALVIMTDWPEFARLDFTRVKAVMSRPVILDGRNLLSDLALADMGFTYLGIGR